MGFVLVPMANEAEHGGGQLGSGCERTVFEHATLQDAEPDLDLVHPRSMKRREDEVEPSAVALVELLPSRAAVDVEVVPNDVDGSLRVLLRECLHEAQEILRTSPASTMGEHLAGARV